MTLAAWDALPEDERAWWIARHEREQEKCPHHGGPRSECSDPEKAWYHNRSVCYTTMILAAKNALYDERFGGKFHDGTFPSDPAEWSSERTADYPFGHRDGVTLWLSPVDLTPGEDFLKD